MSESALTPEMESKIQEAYALAERTAKFSIYFETTPRDQSDTSYDPREVRQLNAIREKLANEHREVLVELTAIISHYLRPINENVSREVGVERYDPKSWSQATRDFLLELRKRDLTYKALGDASDCLVQTAVPQQDICSPSFVWIDDPSFPSPLQAVIRKAIDLSQRIHRYHQERDEVVDGEARGHINNLFDELDDERFYLLLELDGEISEYLRGFDHPILSPLINQDVDIFDLDDDSGLFSASIQKLLDQSPQLRFLCETYDCLLDARL